MTIEQAIQIIEQALLKTMGTRQDHVMWQQAMEAVRKATETPPAT